jgi:sterol desaturase/sphingolipid hydroxylase (fatty acid hydroxylase superfamily)
MKALQGFVTGTNPIYFRLAIALVVGLVLVLCQSFFRARKIQPNGFRWRTFRNEIIFGTINIVSSAFLVGALTPLLQKHGFITYNSAPAAWWVTGLEYIAYFFLFDAWFYWWHRAMHIEPFYKLVHKLHHYSVSPNLVTTLSVHPIESLINGGFVSVFFVLMTVAMLPVHTGTLGYILQTNIIMGLYVHSGYEFFPRWWQKSWATKWFITSTFHDQHHRYFNWNYGGYTTIWDYLCKTQRPKYETDFVMIKDRARKPLAPAMAMTGDKSQSQL